MAVNGKGSTGPARNEGPPERGWRVPDLQVPTGWDEALDAHCAHYLGSSSDEYGELVSDLVRLDVHVHGATEARDFQTIRTGGASDRPTRMPDGVELPDRLEVLMYLPAAWQLGDPVEDRVNDAADGGYPEDANDDRDHEAQEAEDDEDEVRWWPARVIRRLGKYPHEHKTWLGPGHTVDVADIAPVIDGWAFREVLVLDPLLEDPDFRVFSFDGTSCRFLWAIPLTAAESKLNATKGFDALAALMAGPALPKIFDPTRPCVVSGKRADLSPGARKRTIFRR